METYKLIQSELERAKAKHPNFPNDIFQKLAIMQEEAGEVAKAVNEYYFSDGSLQDVKDELIQTAAMCVRMLENLPSEFDFALGTIVKFPENNIEFFQDRRQYSGIPFGIEFTIYKKSSYGNYWLVADGYGNLKKPDSYGNGGILVKGKYIEWALSVMKVFHCQRQIEMESAFTKYDMEKAFLAGADKRNWTKIKLTGVVSGDDFTLEPIFDKWFEHYG